MQIAEVLYPTADYVTVELNRIQCLEAREVIVRTLSTQGESQDSPVAMIPHNLLGSPHLSRRTTAPPHPIPHPQSHPVHSQTHPPYPSTYPPNHPQPQVQPVPRAQPHTLPHAQPHSQPSSHPPPHPPPQPHFQRHPVPKSKPLISAREPETKEHEVGLRSAQPWERSPSPLPPMRGPNLEPPHFPPRRSPSPQRILPQPQGVPIPNTIAKAMAREAAQRVFAEGNRVSWYLIIGQYLPLPKVKMEISHSMFCLAPERKWDFRNIKLNYFDVFSILITTMCFLRSRKGISSVIEVTPCIHSTLTRRRMAMTLLMQGGEEPPWMNSSEAQSWADRYFAENTNKLCSANQ